VQPVAGASESRAREVCSTAFKEIRPTAADTDVIVSSASLGTPASAPVATPDGHDGPGPLPGALLLTARALECLRLGVAALNAAESRSVLDLDLASIGLAALAHPANA
jgi:hypothetical protein